ncbi:MAG: ABC-F family ATP-binding cassette domain-containing protein [Leptospiraceae bacterium]|nr:ABC-F family ATP-binding cassette domain-containing protein [Leptospiraceae bacterium]MCP5496163.1 ABC-F family ATP-binding cassette domain-containing protein [Leptospiraceae bacterium]
MNLISINNLSKTIGNKPLFQEISFGIDEGDKIGIVGVNGSGKTTLLKLLVGFLEPDNGNIYKNKNLKISYLSQNINYTEDQTIEEHIFQSETPIISLIKKYHKACEEIVINSEKQEEMELLHAEMDRVDGWSYESTVKSILQELDIKDLNKPMNTLSGGSLKKVGLAQVLIEDYNMLILDEPTNHLDIDTIVWLQNFLTTLGKTIILVTHDRYFLDSVVNKIYELDSAKLNIFKGNYNYYLEKKAEIESSETIAEEKARAFVKSELDWLKRQPKARGTKQKARIDRIHEVMDRDKKEKSNDIELSVSGRRLGKKILEVQNVSKNFAKYPVINNFSYIFKQKERIGIIGPNGCGKSTLLNLIIGKLLPDLGFVSAGLNTAFGYFEQTSAELDNSLTVIEYIKKTAGENMKLEDGRVITASKMLEKFLFPPSLQYAKIEKISGGERRRLFLVSILMRNPNFLLLDEPTNDLDIQTLSVLENFLEDFFGCVLVVSHDRYFLDRVVDYLLVFQEDKTIKGFPGNYFEYLDFKKDLESKKSEEERLIKKESQPKQSKDSKSVKKISYKEQKELEKIEEEIESLENEKSVFEKVVGDSSKNYNEIAEAGIRLNEIDKLLEEKLERWGYLSSL